MQKTKLNLIRLSFMAASLTPLFALACTNTITDQDKGDDDKKEIKEYKFTEKVVDEKGKDIDVTACTLEDWIKIKDLYEQEIPKIEEKDSVFGLWTKENNLTLEQAYDLKKPNYSVYAAGYKQILEGTKFNIFCLENDGTFEKIMESENKQEVMDFYTKSPTMIKVNSQFNTNFSYGKTYMNNEHKIKKSQNPGNDLEKNNGLKVSNHLNHQFNLQNQKFDKLKGHMQIKGGLQ